MAIGAQKGSKIGFTELESVFPISRSYQKRPKKMEKSEMVGPSAGQKAPLSSVSSLVGGLELIS